MIRWRCNLNSCQRKYTWDHFRRNKAVRQGIDQKRSTESLFFADEHRRKKGRKFKVDIFAFQLPDDPLDFVGQLRRSKVVDDLFCVSVCAQNGSPQLPFEVGRWVRQLWVENVEQKRFLALFNWNQNQRFL